MSETLRRLRHLELTALARIASPVGYGCPLSPLRRENLGFAIVTEGPACPAPAWLARLNAEAAEGAIAHGAILAALREVPS